MVPSIARAYGGPTQSLIAYVRAARSAGCEVEVLSPRPSPADAFWMAEQLRGVQLRLFRAFGSGAAVVSPTLLSHLAHAGNHFGVVHVHGLLNPISSLAARLCLRRGWPVVIRPFGTLSRYTFEHRRGVAKRAYFRLVDGPNVRDAGAVHFTTEAERAEAAWHGLGLCGEVVPPPWVGGSPRPATVRDDATALFLSRLHPVKNVEALLDAWPRVAAEVPGARLVIAGDGEARYAASLRRRAEPLGAAVTFTGFVTGAEKARLLASSTLFVLPSHHENFGYAVVEALAAGLPAVVTPGVQLADFVREHELGAVADDGSATSLALAVARVFRDRALRHSCAERAGALVDLSFSPAAVAPRLLAMYHAARARAVPPSARTP